MKAHRFTWTRLTIRGQSSVRDSLFIEALLKLVARLRQLLRPTPFDPRSKQSRKGRSPGAQGTLYDHQVFVELQILLSPEPDDHH